MIRSVWVAVAGSSVAVRFQPGWCMVCFPKASLLGSGCQLANELHQVSICHEFLLLNFVNQPEGSSDAGQVSDPCPDLLLSPSAVCALTLKPSSALWVWLNKT